MRPTEIDSEREALYELRVVVSRKGDGYVATPINTAGQRMPSLAYTAHTAAKAVQGALREAIRWPPPNSPSPACAS